jgi:hypothetical protein
MTQGPSEPGPTVPPDPGDRQGRPGYSAREQVTRPRPEDQAGAPAYVPTEVVSSYPPSEAGPSYPPQEAGSPSYRQTEASSSGPPTVPARVMPPQEPREAAAPPRRDVPSHANPTVIGARITPNAGWREQPNSDWREQPTVNPPPPPSPPARQPASDLMRYGPGVPPSQAGVSAEQVWRTGQMPEPPRRPVRLRRLASLALTVLLLAAAGVLLFMRFHHGTFHVTAVKIISQTTNGCAVNVTGQIATNGQPGTLSYEWVFTPQQGAPQPLSESVPSGQHDAFVTVAVQGQGHGSITQKVTLQVLGPNQGSNSTVVKVSC